MDETHSPEIKYWFRDFAANLLLTIAIGVLKPLPPGALVFMGRMFGTVAFHLVKRYRNRVLGNLFLAFGDEKDTEEIKKLAKEVFFNFSLTPLETTYGYTHPFDKFVLKIEIQGKEHLEKALAQKKGVIGLGLHLGPFTLVGARLSLEGYPFNIIINEGKFPKLWKSIGDYQRRLGQNPFSQQPTSVSVKKSLNALRRNEILYLVADEQQIRGGLPVPFFGQTAYTPPGPAIFSLKTGAPILPMFIIREAGVPRTLQIGSPLEVERTSDERKDTERLTAEFTRVIEEIVRRYPDQWPWLNRRWKLPYQ